MRSILPMLLGVVPFGLIIGVVAADAAMGTAIAWSTSVIIFGGAAQLVTLELSNAGAAAVVVVATALVVNLRHLMYSAALADPFRAFPTSWRYGLPYLMTDQAFAVSIVRWESISDPTYRRWFFLGAGLTLWVPWQIATTVGVLVGAQIPDAWSLDFAIPLVFMVLIIPAMAKRPGVVAATVGALVAVLARDFPYRLGLMVAAVIGVAAGVVAERRAER
jgi:4-azaleucine resistance transporter AzlC